MTRVLLSPFGGTGGVDDVGVVAGTLQANVGKKEG